jgi:hypothetical protein
MGPPEPASRAVDDVVAEAAVVVGAESPLHASLRHRWHRPIGWFQQN